MLQSVATFNSIFASSLLVEFEQSVSFSTVPDLANLTGTVFTQTKPSKNSSNLNFLDLMRAKKLKSDIAQAELR